MQLVTSNLLYIEKLMNIIVCNFFDFFMVYLYNNVYYNLNTYVNLVNLKFCFTYLTSSIVVPWVNYNLYRTIFSTYFKEFLLDGIYYRVKYYKYYNMLGFILGYNHYILYKLPLGIKVCVHMKKRKFILYSFDLLLLNKIAFEIVALKIPNIYKGRGVRLISRYYRRKTILKKTR